MSASLIEGALMGLAVGLGINEISGSPFGHRAAAIIIAAAAVVFVSNRVRRRPPNALLPELVTWACLVLAMVGIVTAGFGSRNWSGYAVVVATALTTIAVMVSAEADRAFALLFGTAFIGLGVALIGAAAGLTDRGYLLKVGGIGYGVAAIGAGVARLIHRNYLFGAAMIGGGVAMVGVGVGWLRDQPGLRRSMSKLCDRLLGTTSDRSTDGEPGG